MSMETLISCDGHKCLNSLIQDGVFCEFDMESLGWHEDPGSCDYHYCPECWPKVKEELEAEED